MGFYSEKVRTTQRCQMVEITARVKEIVAKSKVKDGLVTVYVPHTTAAVTINENADPDVKHDLVKKLGEMVPKEETYYRHGEGNSDSHVKVSMVGPSVTVIVDEGELVLGTWQGIQFCEFDGPREREFFVKVIGG